MNASATIRNEYVRASIIHLRPPGMQPSLPLESRPIDHEKLKDFKKVDYEQYREECEQNRVANDVTHIGRKASVSESFMDFDDDDQWFPARLCKMFTVFPYRDPIYLVAIIFMLGSLDLVINAFLDLIPRTLPEEWMEKEEKLETIAVPTTVLIGSILFFAAGVFDIFGALNADRGTLETSKEDLGGLTYQPALLGSPEFKWIPSWIKFMELLTTNLAFQAGLLVLFGGVIFMFAGIVDFPGVIDEESPFFASIVFGPQVIHGLLFFVANTMLAISDQEKWYIPKIRDPDWQGAFLNATGGFWFMLAGFFFFRKDELLAAAAAMTGSWAFLIGSLIRWYVVMEFC